MINFDDYANENKTKHKLKWPYIPDHPYRILIIRGFGSGKTNLSLNLINNQPDINKIYLYAKDPYEAKHQFLINKRELITKKKSQIFRQIHLFLASFRKLMLSWSLLKL